MIVSIFIYSIIKSYLVFNIYQQAHYQIKPYLKHFLKNFLYYDLFVIVLFIVGSILNNILLDIICGSYITFYSFLYLFNRKKLVFTKRILRLMALSSIIFILGIIPYINGVLLGIEYLMIPIFGVESWISKRINKPYIIKAKEKLSKFNGKIIGITGSYGKSSSKVLFEQVLKCFNSVIVTPKSYNTPLGISRFINDTIIDFNDYLVLEYGISKENDMDELNELTNLDVVMITEIGYMHITGFKNIDCLIKEKMKIIEGLKENGVLILNYDCKYIRESNFEPKNIVSYGFDFGKYQAKNVRNGSFDYYVDGNFVMNFKTNLVGKHQILNLLGVISYCDYIGYDLEIIKRVCLGLKGLNNRLELKKYGNRYILDDSFNSNYKGFINALNILKDSPGKRVLLTPGMVELGKYHQVLMEGLQSYIVNSSDIVILIGYHQTKGLYYLLKEYAIEVYMVKNFMEGYRLYLEISKYYNTSTLLIENDLPDLYRVGLFC